MTDNNTNILIVDDDQDIRDYVMAVLGNTIAASLHEVADGEAAIEFCEMNRPDLVLLDILMPIQDGFSVAAALKRMQIPFVAMTSMVDNETIRRIIELGSFSFLAKPVNQAQLVGTVASALAHVQQIEALRDYAASSRDIGTARGALSAYLSIHPDQAFDVMNEMARDQHGNSRDVAHVINNFLSFMSKANNKLNTQRNRKSSAHKKRPQSDT